MKTAPDRAYAAGARANTQNDARAKARRMIPPSAIRIERCARSYARGRTAVKEKVSGNVNGVHTGGPPGAAAPWAQGFWGVFVGSAAGASAAGALKRASSIVGLISTF